MTALTSEAKRRSHFGVFDQHLMARELLLKISGVVYFLVNLLKRIISKAIQLYDLMTKPPMKSIRDKVKAVSCHARRNVRESLPPNNIRVQLPGNRGHLVVIRGDEQIGILRMQIAKDMGVKERNWGIYVPNADRLKIVEDTIRVNQVDRNKLHFYPKAVIR